MATIRCEQVEFFNVQAIIFDKDGTLAAVESFLCDLAYRRSRFIDAQIPGIEAALLRAFGVEDNKSFDHKSPESSPNPSLDSQKHYGLNPAGLMAVGSRQENAIGAAAYVSASGKDWAQSLDLVQTAFQAADRSSPAKTMHTPLLPGALPLVQACAAAGLRLAILSSDSQTHVDDFIATYQLSHYFQVAVGVQENLSKSDPKLLEQVLFKLGIASEQTLMIGDSQIDIQITKEAHLLGCIGFTGGWSRKPNLMNANVLLDRLDRIQIA